MKAHMVVGGLALGLAFGAPAALAEGEDFLKDGELMAIAAENPQVDPCDPRMMTTEEELTLRDGDYEELEPSTQEVTEVRVMEPREERSTRTYVMLGGGAEGYTGQLNHDFNVGPAWGVTLGVGGKVVGLEAAYSGAATQLDSRVGNAGGSGVDMVRQGGQAALKLNLSPTPFHPYLLGGVGFEHRNFRNGEQLGFESGTNGYIPAAAGLRWNLGAFTADLRASYNFLFEDDFAPGNPTGDRVQATLMLGGTL